MQIGTKYSNMHLYIEYIIQNRTLTTTDIKIIHFGLVKIKQSFSLTITF